MTRDDRRLTDQRMTRQNQRMIHRQIDAQLAARRRQTAIAPTRDDRVDVGFTGTRGSLTLIQQQTVRELLGRWRPIVFRHGDCVGGDETAHDIADELGIYIVVHPPLETGLRAYRRGNLELPSQPYLERNRAIVDASDLVIAAPGTQHEAARSGTWWTINYAHKIDRPTYVVYPEGQLEVRT